MLQQTKVDGSGSGRHACLHVEYGNHASNHVIFAAQPCSTHLQPLFPHCEWELPRTHARTHARGAWRADGRAGGGPSPPVGKRELADDKSAAAWRPAARQIAVINEPALVSHAVARTR